VRQREEFAPAMPAWQTAKGIGAEQQHQGALLAMLATQSFKRGDRIAGASGKNFAGVDVAIGKIGDGALGHRQPFFRRGLRRIAQRRAASRYENDLFQRQQFAGFNGQTQMCDVRWIEGAAKNAQ
jgi:hypothetical protein